MAKEIKDDQIGAIPVPAVDSNVDFFEDKEVAAAYNATFKSNPIITIPGIYDGPLSKISLMVAEKLISFEDNQISAKAK